MAKKKAVTDNRTPVIFRHLVSGTTLQFEHFDADGRPLFIYPGPDRLGPNDAPVPAQIAEFGLETPKDGLGSPLKPLATADHDDIGDGEVAFVITGHNSKKCERTGGVLIPAEKGGN